MIIARCLAGLFVAFALSTAAAARDLSKDVGTFADRFGWPGAVALEVTRDGIGETVVRGECQPGKPLTLDTPMMVGSVSKALTARAVLSLARQGRLDLDAPLGRAWPELGAVGNLTPRQLLTHTSGFSARQGMTVTQPPDLSRLAPDETAGERRYSNLNYNLLGALVAHQGSASFDQAIATLVTKPDGLASLAVAGEAAKACGHTLAFGVTLQRPEPAWSPWIAPAGFLQVSPADLAHFEKGILNDPDAGQGSPLDPLIGWKSATIAGEHVYSHSGQIGGSRATLVVVPSRGKGLVIVVNRGGDLLQDPVDQLALRSLARLQGRPQPPLPWPWERLLRFTGLLLLAVSVWRLALSFHRSSLADVRSWRWGITLAGAIIVPAAILQMTALSAASLWRLAPDLFVLLMLGPALALSRWAIRPRLR
jgi:CubicO group peptidase (beta-lactamase class C family)